MNSLLTTKLSKRRSSALTIHKDKKSLFKLQLKTAEKVRKEIFKYIESPYNQRRIYSSFDYISLSNLRKPIRNIYLTQCLVNVDKSKIGIYSVPP